MTEELQQKWSSVLNHEDLTPIKDPYKKAVTALVLENQVQAMRSERQQLNKLTMVQQTQQVVSIISTQS